MSRTGPDISPFDAPPLPLGADRDLGDVGDDDLELERPASQAPPRSRDPGPPVIHVVRRGRAAPLAPQVLVRPEPLPESAPPGPHLSIANPSTGLASGEIGYLGLLFRVLVVASVVFGAIVVAGEMLR